MSIFPRTLLWLFRLQYIDILQTALCYTGFKEPQGTTNAESVEYKLLLLIPNYSKAINSSLQVSFWFVAELLNLKQIKQDWDHLSLLPALLVPGIRKPA